jgi:LuxR family transcriptional regulator, maltose regulon positive regulatory protein
MTQTLVRTKLNRPRVSRDIVQRPALVQRLNAGLERSLTLVIAPPGFGKTMLVAEWVSQAPQRVAWLSLDESDNDLVTLVGYLIAAIRQLFPGACPDTEALIHAALVPNPETLVSVLTNEIDDLPDRFVLVLDDYHFVTEPALHQLFDQLLYHLPLQLHLLLTSRSDPPLALPRLRANRALNELRSADLRFSPQETEIFLAQRVGVEHSAPLADVLLKYTEGWVAGLQLAALSLPAAPDALALAENLTRARNRHITAYFFEQVWQRQTPRVQAILMKTSILDRLSSALAQAVLAEDKAPSLPVDLAALERAGLFLNAVDETGEWFTCHALFREMLFDTLHKTCAPDEIATLHFRASRWFHRNRLIDEALRHAVAAGAAELAAQIVADNIADRLNREDWHALERWLRPLPAQWMETQPWLLVAEAYVSSFQFQYYAIPPLLKKAEQQLLAGAGIASPDRALLSGYVQALWSQHWIGMNEAELAREVAQQALDNLPLEHILARGVAFLCLIMALHSLGDFTTAERILNEALAAEASSSSGYFLVRVLLALTALYLAEGNIAMLTQAAEWLRQKAAEANLPVGLAWAYMMLGMAAYEANDLSRAAGHFAATAALYYAGHIRAGHECLVGLALLEQARGHRDAARRAVADLLDFQRDLVDPMLSAESDSLQARLALVEGDLETARRWSSSARLDLTLWWFGWLEVPAITHIRVGLTERSRSDLERTRRELDALLDLATRLHKPRRRVELLSLKALLLERLNEGDEALKTLEAALALGDPRGLVRSIVDAGPQLEPLLKVIALRAPSQYLDRVLAAFPPAADSTVSSPGVTPAVTFPIVSLTHREQDVLALLGRRYTDREIAEALVISPLTVRYHIENLSEKLGVRGRRKVVARAREMGLLSQD